MRLAAQDLEAFDSTCADLQTAVGRRVERTEVVRELMAMFVQDTDIQRRVSTGLEGRGVSRGGDVGLGL